jgi:putative endonuclease
VTLAYLETVPDRAEASRREAAIKRLDRRRKLALCTDPVSLT